MLALIYDLLNYSRITDSRVLFRTTDLNQILENVLKDFKLFVDEKADIITKIIQINHGEILAVSSLNEGAEMHVILPENQPG